jgi:RING-like zinc finger
MTSVHLIFVAQCLVCFRGSCHACPEIVVGVQELDESDVLGGGEDDSEHPITAAASYRDDINDENDLISVDGEAGKEEGRRPLDVEAGGGTAVAAGLDDDEEQRRRGERATFGSESADLSTSFGDGTSSSRAWIRVTAAGHPQETNQDRRCRQRLVPSQCAICLSSMARGENVTWSSNPNCQHVFHYRCVQIGSGAAVSRASAAQQRVRHHLLCAD